LLKSWGSVKHFVKLSGQNDQSFDLPPLLEGFRQATLVVFISGYLVDEIAFSCCSRLCPTCHIRPQN
jgi:hypothetical protein